MSKWLGGALAGAAIISCAWLIASRVPDPIVEAQRKIERDKDRYEKEERCLAETGDRYNRFNRILCRE
jgi:hypothetical protein